MEKTRPHPSDASGVVKLLVLVKTLAFNFFDWLSKAGNPHKTRPKVGCTLMWSKSMTGGASGGTSDHDTMWVSTFFAAFIATKGTAIGT